MTLLTAYAPAINTLAKVMLNAAKMKIDKWSLDIQGTILSII